MTYQATIHDFFEISAWPRKEAFFVYEGGDADNPLTFGPIIQPLTFETRYNGDVMVNDTVTIGETQWTVKSIGEGLIGKFHGDPWTDNHAPYASSALYVIRLENGADTKFFAVEMDEFYRPVLNTDHQEVTVTHFWVQSFDNSTRIQVKTVATDHPDMMHAVCFAAGTMIETAAGPRPVQSLRVGDLVRTRDRGLQPLRWLGGRRLSGPDLARAPKLAPIRIAAGALGPGMPAQDLTVSPQHRMLVRSPIAARMTGDRELLVAAVHLLGLPGVTRLNAPEGVGYWHMMFDAHEIVFANGAEAESLQLGPMAIKALTPAALAEIGALFPDLVAGTETRPTARTVLPGGQTRKLVERQVRNAKPLVAPL